MEAELTQALYHRGEERLPVPVLATAYNDQFVIPMAVEGTDLSSQGMFLVSPSWLAVGDQVYLSFCPPGSKHTVIIDAVVVREHRGDRAGMGVRFARMTRSDQSLLRDRLAAERRRTWRRSSPRTAPSID